MTTGIFITIEGPEGSGKTTQARFLNEYLRERGYDVLWTLEPGGTQTGKQIREILLHSDETIDPFTELMLFEAARAQHVRELLVPALESGKVILCDRYSDSTLAYQGYGRGINLKLARALDLIATGGLYPDLTLLLDIDPVDGMARRFQKGKVEVRIGENGRALLPEESGLLDIEVPLDADRIEREEMDFHTRVRNGFLELAQIHSERFTVIDASRSDNQVRSEIVRVADTLLALASQTESIRKEKLASVRRNLADGALVEELRRVINQQLHNH